MSTALLPNKVAGGSRVHVLVCLPSLIPSLAKLPSFKNAAANNIGSNSTPVPVRTIQTCNSNFGGCTSVGHGNDKYAVINLFIYLRSMSIDKFCQRIGKKYHMAETLKLHTSVELRRLYTVTF